MAQHMRATSCCIVKAGDTWYYWDEVLKMWATSENDAEWLNANLRPIGVTTTISAPAILEAAAGHMKDRAATYDKPAGERSMGATVKAFEAVTGVTITEEQGWLFMQLLKAVRSQQGAYREDSYADGAAYVALAGEAAARDRQGDRSC